VARDDISRRRRVIVGFSGRASKKIIFSRKCFTLSPSPRARHSSIAAAVVSFLSSRSVSGNTVVGYVRGVWIS